MADKDYGPRVGADPELFVQNAEGKIVPVCGKVGGTKEVPLIINNLVDGHYGAEAGRRRGEESDREGDYAVQEDNVMLEFNVPAYIDRSSFVESIEKILHIIGANVLAPRELSLKYEVMHTFKTEDLTPFPQAFSIGCLPDMNAYAEGNLFERAPFTAATFGNHRFCGGHLHVQYNHGNVPRHIFAQFMDLVVELPCLRWDKQHMRRLFYGQPGIYREKPYGIEYRTPSNFWLSRNFRERWFSQIVDNIFTLANTANTNPESLKQMYSKINWYEVQQAIKTENIKLADDIIEHARMRVGVIMGPPTTR